MVEQERYALLLRYRAQAPLDRFETLSGNRRHGWIVDRALLHVRAVGHPQTLAPPAPAPAVCGHADGNSVQPGRKRAPTVELVEGAKRLCEDPLNEVFGISAVTQ